MKIAKQEVIMEQIREEIRASKTLTGPFPSFHTDDASEFPHELFFGVVS